MPRNPKPRKHGNWWVTESGGRGLHQLCPATASFETAKTKLAEYLAGIGRERQAGLVEVESLTVTDLVGALLDHKAATRPGRTYDYYRYYLERFLEWYGDVDPRRLELADGAKYITRLQKLPTIKSNATINHYIQVAKAVFNFAVDNDRLLKNPWRKLKKLPEVGRQRTMTDAEFQKLLDTCDKCIAYRGLIDADDAKHTMRDILHVMRYTALRPGELRKLRWDHLHLKEGFIIIPAHETKTGNTAKKPQDRIVPILEEAKAVLMKRKAKWGHQPRVFADIHGKEWTDYVFSRRFARLRKRAGIDEPDHNGERLTWYHLRHTRLSEAGTVEKWDFYTLMRFAGHTTPDMTKRYIHVEKDALRRMADEGERKRKAATPTAG